MLWVISMHHKLQRNEFERVSHVANPAPPSLNFPDRPGFRKWSINKITNKPKVWARMSTPTISFHCSYWTKIVCVMIVYVFYLLTYEFFTCNFQCFRVNFQCCACTAKRSDYILFVYSHVQHWELSTKTIFCKNFETSRYFTLENIDEMFVGYISD